jgi:hypothetical protein
LYSSVPWSGGVPSAQALPSQKNKTASKKTEPGYGNVNGVEALYIPVKTTKLSFTAEVKSKQIIQELSPLPGQPCRTIFS